MSKLRRDQRHAGDDYHFGTAPNAFLAAQKERLPVSGTALAVADGEGRNGVWLAEQGLDVLAVDSRGHAGMAALIDLVARKPA